MDGSAPIHDTYRVNRGGNGTHHQVMKGLAALRRHDVDVHILCTVNAANQDHGAAVYRYLRDELEARWMQFIPVLERATSETLPLANRGWSAGPSGQRLLYTQRGSLVTERSVRRESYGQFLVESSRSGCVGTSGRCSCSCST